MNKTRLLSVLVIGLLIINLLLVGFIFTNGPRPSPDGPKKIIAERLHFDAHQISEYDQLIGIHQSRIASTDSLIRMAKSELYSSIGSNNLERKDSLKKKLGQLQIAIEDIHYNHFLDIRKLCHPNQMNDFNTLLKDMSNLFPARPKDRHHR